MASIPGLPDEGRDALMGAALDPPGAALESWRQFERSGTDARTGPIASRWLPLIDDPPPLSPKQGRDLFIENLQRADASIDRRSL